MSARIACVAFLLLAACPHPLPNPGQVVLTCGMAEASDPKVVQAVLDALAAPDFRGKLAALVGALPGVTAEVIACVLESYLGRPAATPEDNGRHERARTYLREHHYEAP